jgi:mannitol/fructose-specific phosphotransferase system IIA component (Ntr-type)
MGMLMSQLFDARHILAPLSVGGRDELFSLLAKTLAELDSMDEKRIREGIFGREAMMTTMIAPGIALPHTQLKGFGKCAGIMAVMPAGCDYTDGSRIRLAALLVDDSLLPDAHYETLRRFALLAKNPRFLDKMCAAATPAQAHAVITRMEMTS